MPLDETLPLPSAWLWYHCREPDGATTPSNPQQSPSARKVKKGKEDKKGKKEKKPRYERTRALVGWAAGEVADRTGITWAYGHLMVRRTPQPPQPPPPAC